MAHEFKHIVDHRFIHLLYPAIGALSSHDRAEQMADHFAASRLMPRAWVQRKWDDGTRDVAALARTFDVSRSAMRYRLSALGLVEPYNRCLQGVA